MHLDCLRVQPNFQSSVTNEASDVVARRQLQRAVNGNYKLIITQPANACFHWLLIAAVDNIM